MPEASHTSGALDSKAGEMNRGHETGNVGADRRRWISNDDARPDLFVGRRWNVAIDSVALATKLRSGSRFFLSGVGTQMMTTSVSTIPEESMVA
nr:hypothetical protein [Mesorhizobium mediterraneum]